MLRLAIVLGGPSEEKGISLNSARTIMDHTSGIGVQLEELIYYDSDCRPFSITRGLLYCNTTLDFDFKLQSPDSEVGVPLTDAELVERLQGVDLVFPAIHGEFGEDGGLQALLDEARVPYVGTAAAECRIAFDKFLARDPLMAAGIAVVPSVLVTIEHTAQERAALLASAHPQETSIVLKPAQSGSSYGVRICTDRELARTELGALLETYGRVMIQPRIQGTEWTTSVLDGPDGPVALMPTEVELRKTQGEHDYHDTERKYLFSDRVHYYCPPRFDSTADVQAVSERAFAALGLRDFARIDGWRLEDGSLLVSDVNPICGMDHTSFLFVQAAQIGMNHGDLLRFVVGTAAKRVGLPWSGSRAGAGQRDGRRRLPVLFGGDTAERHVSVMSGLNVWLKLQESERFDPAPYLLQGSGTVWELSYASALHHSVEEIVQACSQAAEYEGERALLEQQIHARLGLTAEDMSAPVKLPVKMSLEQFMEGTDLVFIALHGGIGENGTLQVMFDEHRIRYNGSGPEASRLCIDKAATGEVVLALSDERIGTARRAQLPVPAEPDRLTAEEMWGEAVSLCGTEDVLVKPVDDGCSAGVLRLAGADELLHYLEANDLPGSELHGRDFRYLEDDEDVEMPMTPQRELLIEEFIETDDIAPRVDSSSSERGLRWGKTRDTKWVETTVGVLGPHGSMRALNPSITVATTRVLSMQDKFMSGTGINLTPPPEPPAGRVESAAVDHAKQHIERVARALGLRGYARIDAFMHRESGDIVVIEANTLPGLTPATVLFHQGVAEQPALVPRQLLERIVDLALE